MVSLGGFQPNVDRLGPILALVESSAAPTSPSPAPCHAHKSSPVDALPLASLATSFWLLHFSSSLVNWIGGFLPLPAPPRGAKPNLPKRSRRSVFPTFCFEFKRQWLTGSWAGVMCRSAESQESKLNLLLMLEHGPNYDIIENYSLTRECYNAGRNTALMHIHQPEDHLNAMGSERLQTSASVHSTLVFFAAEVVCLCHVPAVLSVLLFPLACGGLSDTTSSLALKKKIHTSVALLARGTEEILVLVSSTSSPNEHHGWVQKLFPKKTKEKAEDSCECQKGK